MPLPNPGGTCAVSQFVVGHSTSGPGYGLLPSVFVSQPVQNTGPECVLELPKVIGFANSTGAYQAVEVPIGNVQICKKASPDHQACNYRSPISTTVDPVEQYAHLPSVADARTTALPLSLPAALFQVSEIVAPSLALP